MPRRIGKTPDRHFRADDALYNPAKSKAANEGRSLSWVLRHALRLYLAGELPMPGHQDPGDAEGPAPEAGEGAGPG